MSCDVTLENGWYVLVFVAAVGVVVAFLTQGIQHPILYYYIQYSLILGIIGGWVWLPIVFYRAWKRGEI